MCSWCWGFEKVKKKLYSRLPENIIKKRLLGGLAKDTDQPMPEDMKIYLQQTWRKIELTIPGRHFNFDFWSKCSPRRSTYPSNRAIIAAREQGTKYDEIMTERIQRAYYEEARNPSDRDLLIELSSEIGLDERQFSVDIASKRTESILLEEINLCRTLGASSFPSLIVVQENLITPITINYLDVEEMIESIVNS